MILLDVTPGAGEFDRDVLERFGHPVKGNHLPTVADLDGFAAEVEAGDRT